jgi:hypothetical protein
MTLYYLTTAQSAISDIALRRVKISRFADLNDPFELLAVNLADKQSRTIFRSERERVNEELGLICLSTEWKNPLMWGHYADKHTGMALGFRIPRELVKSVKYKARLAKATIDAKKSIPSKSLIDELLRTKFKDWEYEQEMRLFLSLRDRTSENGMYFEYFSDRLQLREVILGPKCSIPISDVRTLVRAYKPKVEVIKSRIAFTRFEVLKNRAASRLDDGV